MSACRAESEVRHGSASVRTSSTGSPVRSSRAVSVCCRRAGRISQPSVSRSGMHRPRPGTASAFCGVGTAIRSRAATPAWWATQPWSSTSSSGPRRSTARARRSGADVPAGPRGGARAAPRPAGPRSRPAPGWRGGGSAPDRSRPPRPAAPRSGGRASARPCSTTACCACSKCSAENSCTGAASASAVPIALVPTWSSVHSAPSLNPSWSATHPHAGRALAPQDHTRRRR